ncbi:tetrapyrrole methylase family protein / MazG family protein [Propionispira arboris]|uniref:Tetrapyrrole methylase family protein / MazG family protein n=1 Tax=Propionispira arboris TaxID=84035 RepID=A0A1H7CT18_9FIRM|nr:nucleoside triphosphate pyrophosphohydrolase [Propionispira arboris]SEJ92808.1 tetrapyrrole methylase family protein / MazG family protein [Propionispira arboris]
MGEITIVGLGPGEFGFITLDTWDKIKQAATLLLRTAKHPTVAEIKKREIAFESYDTVYTEKETFEEVYRSIAANVVERAQKGEDIVYAVPGSPLVAERTVVLIRDLAAERQVKLTILPGMSFVEVLYVKLGVDPIDGLTIIDSADLETLPPDLATALVITQVYNQQVASDTKLSLMETYPDDYEITLVRNLGLPDEAIYTLPLYELDRQTGIDHLTSVYIPTCEAKQKRFEMKPLTDIMKILRSPGGCPWDIEQNHQSLRRNIIEEVYEVIEAIDLENPKLLCEELGDLLLQIVFHARMAEEAGSFSMQDVIDGITEKLIRRHPHVFGDITVKDAGEVVLNWDAIKKIEKAAERKSVLDGVPKDLPSLMRAYKLQHKAAKVGFDWADIGPVWDKVTEELNELKEAVLEKDQKHIEEELGDLLFSIVNVSRFLKVDAEIALNRANYKFLTRFLYIEEQVQAKSLKWENVDINRLNVLWNEAKALNL